MSTICSTKKSKTCTDRGLGVHQLSAAIKQWQFVGLEICDGHLSIKRNRIWKLRFALDRVFSLSRIAGKILGVLVGHCTWCMLLRRESLSIFCHVYELIRKHRDACTFMAFSVRQELEHIRNVPPLIRTNLHNPLCSTVHASDACSAGLGVCARVASLSTVGRIAQFSEKWRYQIEGKIHGRHAAFGGTQDINCPEFDHGDYLTYAQLLDVDREQFHEAALFHDVPWFVLEPKDWQVVHMSKLSLPEFITRSEGRAVVISAKHLLRSCQPHGTRALVDNMSFCLAATRGRSSSSSLGKVCRQLGALALCPGTKFCVRWICSELNISD
jgi:hypothetical protein